jgi:DNA-binding transcriptional regulator YiaG
MQRLRQFTTSTSYGRPRATADELLRSKRCLSSVVAARIRERLGLSVPEAAAVLHMPTRTMARCDGRGSWTPGLYKLSHKT